MSVLSPRALEVLRRMAEVPATDEDAEIMVEGWEVWHGMSRIHRSTFNRLIRCGALSRSYDEGPYWHINNTGRAIARRPELADEVEARYQIGTGAFTIRNDRIVPI